MRDMERDMADRRKFLKATASLTALTPITAGLADTSDLNKPEIQRHVTLGKTGLRISEIGFGSSSLQNESLVSYALERGVTYFDTAESYRFGWSEEAMGKGLKGHRDNIVLASKTKAQANSTESEMMEALEASLKRLQTDYLDIYFNHAVNRVNRMENDAWANFTEKAVMQGKIRFRGMSGHGSRLAKCLEYSIDNDLVDVILCAYNFGEDPDLIARLKNKFHFAAEQSDLPPVLDKAHEKNIGVIAMKTLLGARLNDMRKFEAPGRTYAQAALRWVLSSPRVDAAIISMNSMPEIDEYIGASVLEDEVVGDAGLLGRYAAMQSGKYCHHGCDKCESACPHGVDIAEVLRTRMYDVDYGNKALAIEDYARLRVDGLLGDGSGDAASACLTCDNKVCAGACPYGVPIPEFTLDAARRLG